MFQPQQGYKPWDLAGPNGLKVVSMPGGELAIWRPPASSSWNERLESFSWCGRVVVLRGVGGRIR